MNEVDPLYEYFTENELALAKRLFNPFYDKIYLIEDVSNEDAVLLSVYMACNKKESSSIEYDDAKEVYLKFGRRKDYFKRYLSIIVEKRLVEREKNILRLTAAGIMRVKELLGSEFGIKTFLIKAGETFSGRRKVEEIIFENLSGIVYICDPYIDERTLDFLSKIPCEAHIFLLTKLVSNPKKFKRCLDDFIREYRNINLEIRIHRGNVLHDRFIVVKGRKLAYSMGISLNGIGKKDCLITELPKEIIEALTELFERRWSEAQPFVT